MSKNPKITDKNFNTKIAKTYKKYKIPSTKKTLNDICFPKKYKLQLPQQFVSKFLHPKNKYDGLLVFHQIGAGKTCAAINIGENFKGKKKVFIITPASLIDNMYKEFMNGCVGDEYVDFKYLQTLKPKSNEYNKIIKDGKKKINKYYKILSYNKFVDLIIEKKINLNNSLLIIDEVQNIISEGGHFYETILNAINKAKDNKIVLLSGTPIFDKPNELGLLMNLLKPKNKLPIGTEFNNTFLEKKSCASSDICYYNIKNINLLNNYLRGYISYFRGAPPIAFPKKNFNLVYCNMSDYQYKSYLTVNQDEGFRTGQILDLPSNFFLGSRIISNIAYPNKKINDEGLASLRGNKLLMSNLKNYSIKFYFILKKIKKSKGTIFIYSNFKNHGGILTLAKILDNLGYKHFSKYGEGKKRYAIWSGENSKTEKENIRSFFNQKSNFDGSKLKIVLGTPSIKEGVSLLRVSQVHILEPYWNNQLIEQVIGRAVRFCSHKDVAKKDRKVDIFLYLSIHKTNKNTIDQYIWDIANNKQEIIDKFELFMKESAVDCKLNYNSNVISKKTSLKCQK